MTQGLSQDPVSMQDRGLAKTTFQHASIDFLDLAWRQGLDGHETDGWLDVPFDVALITAGRPECAVGGDAGVEPVV